ncbi:MAG: efflux RND transporter periplasmic adaptor subunit [Sorangiineae bacterium]|nr:efflux RND transporter periplasmic adaptor subunit [Polyangiaceae bacterium]MEB2322956.1 efflux RND transporter periplasmic adaptor subunit [Sorangiineae bacterium]
MKTWLKVTLVAGAIAGVSLGAVVIQRVAAQTVTVESGEVEQRVVARAVVVPIDGIAHVVARIDGKVSRVLVREGDLVKKGELLAELVADTASDELARREAEHRSLVMTERALAAGARPEERAALDAEVRAAEHELAAATDRRARDEKLLGSGAVTQEILDGSRRSEEIARARVDAARARRRLAGRGARAVDISAAKARADAAQATIDAARHELDWTRLESPMDGVVLERRIDEGDVIANARMGGTIAFEIADPSRTELHAEVEEIDAMRIRAGLPVTITWPGGRGALGTGKLTRVGAQLQRRTIGAADARERGEGWVRSAWIEPKWGPSVEGGLPIGQRVEVRIVLPSERVSARVPRSAIRVHDGRATVSVAGGLLFRDAPVELGAADERYVEVRGVSPGASIRAER